MDFRPKRPKETKEIARYRIFGAPNQGYGTGLGQAVPASGSWDDEKKLSDLYIDRLNFAYGRNVWGKKSREAFTEALKGTDTRKWNPFCGRSKAGWLQKVRDGPTILYVSRPSSSWRAITRCSG